MENNTFKTVTFGGFAKQDVIDYIEKNARDSAAVQEKLRQENESLKAEVDALRLQVDGLRTRLDAMDVERSRLTAELERETQRRQELEPLEPEAARLSEEAERLRPDAEAYAQFRERIGAIECEARKRAADLEAASQAQMRRTVETFRTQYQALMHTFNSTAAHVTGELRKVEVNLTQLPRAMDQASVELKELEKLLEQNSGQNG